MLIGSDSRESAFRELGMENYVDQVIVIKITGDTVKNIDEVASLTGLTSEQWIFRTIATELIRCEGIMTRVINDYVDQIPVD